jgi:hypothetical protein
VCPFSRDLRRQIRYNARSRPRILRLFLTGSVMLACMLASWGSYGVGYLSSIVSENVTKKRRLKRIISPLRRAEIAEIEVMHEH